MPSKSKKIYQRRSLPAVLRIGEALTVGEGDLEFGVLAMEIVLQAIKIAGTLPFTHGEVVEQIVAASLWARGWNLILSENPLEALDGETAHIFNSIVACHDDIHACETAHGTNVDHIVLDLGVAEPGGHEMFDAMDGGWCHSGLFVGLGDTQVIGDKTFILARDVDAGLEVSMIEGKTLYNFHNLKTFDECFGDLE